MEKIDKYKYEARAKRIPYTCEKVIASYPGCKIKEYELFDGNKVIWNIVKDSGAKSKYIKPSSPFFDNVTDQNNMDRKRIIYQNDDNHEFVALGRIDDRDVLFRGCDSDTNFGKFLDFGGNKVRVSAIGSGKVRIDYIDRFYIEKVLLFDCKNFIPYSNEFDGIYDDEYFLKSYRVGERGDYIRAIVGIVNTSTGEVSPIAFDITLNDYIELPLKENRLIDDGKLKEIFNNTRSSLYFTYYSRDFVRSDLDIGLNQFLMYDNSAKEVKEELIDRNKGKRMMLVNTHER